MRVEYMTIDQSLELNRVIYRRIDNSKIRKYAGAELPPGLHITNINRRSVLVLTEDSAMQYKISPGLLGPFCDVN